MTATAAINRHFKILFTRITPFKQFFGFLGFGFYDTAVGIINIVREISVIDALGNALPGSRLAFSG